MRQCKVLYNGRYAGVLTEKDTGGYTFTYDKGYFEDPNARPVCLAMPLREAEYEDTSLFPFFCNLLPEGSNKRYFCSLYHISPEDEFGLLLKCGSGDTIGPVTIEQI